MLYPAEKYTLIVVSAGVASLIGFILSIWFLTALGISVYLVATIIFIEFAKKEARGNNGHAFHYHLYFPKYGKQVK